MWEQGEEREGGWGKKAERTRGLAFPSLSSRPEALKKLEGVPTERNRRDLAKQGAGPVGRVQFRTSLLHRKMRMDSTSVRRPSSPDRACAVQGSTDRFEVRLAATPSPPKPSSFPHFSLLLALTEVR